MKERGLPKYLETLKKYRLATAVILLGVVLMLLPGGETAEQSPPRDAETEAFDRAAVQSEMEDILRGIDGVGELTLMLTVDAGTRRELAQNVTEEQSGGEDTKKKTETLVLGAGSGVQNVVVTESVYPRYVGALVVCEGADSASVRLAVTNAVSVLTALPSDRISVVRGKP